jgi:hypothetical protein
VDGVDRGDVVAAGADEVGADAAVSGEGGQRVPVAGDGLVSFGAFEGLLGGVVRPGHGEVRVKVQSCSALAASRRARVYPG